MTVNPFLAGVLFTIFFELILLVTVSLIAYHSKDYIETDGDFEEEESEDEDDEEE